MIWLGTLVIACAIALMIRQIEIRLILIGAGLLMTIIAGRPLAIADAVARGMVATMVAPICASMGFAAVMRVTECDRHLVQLLIIPLTKLRWLVVPGGILVAYLVNMAISSQASTAAALGPILVPLMLSSGRAPVTAGAALVLGASFGGDLLNPGAQDVLSLAGATQLSAQALSARLIPASAAGAIVAAATFALLQARGRGILGPEAPMPVAPENARSLIRALVPLLPIILLLAAYGGIPGLAWLLEAPGTPEWRPLANALPVVRAMLLGSVIALIVGYRHVQQLTRTFFEGMGNAYGNIISLTIAAQCFGVGVAALGISQVLLELATASHSLIALAGLFPWALALLSGSGSGPILTFAQTFLAEVDAGVDTAKLGAIACLGGAFGRTMSPVAAVVVYSAGLVGVSPVALVRVLWPALAAGAAVAFAVALR